MRHIQSEFCCNNWCETTRMIRLPANETSLMICFMVAWTLIRLWQTDGPTDSIFLAYTALCHRCAVKMQRKIKANLLTHTHRYTFNDKLQIKETYPVCNVLSSSHWQLSSCLILPSFYTTYYTYNSTINQRYMLSGMHASGIIVFAMSQHQHNVMTPQSRLAPAEGTIRTLCSLSRPRKMTAVKQRQTKRE